MQEYWPKGAANGCTKHKIGLLLVPHCDSRLHAVVAEDVVLVAAGALDAAKAADQKNCHSGRHDQCQKASARKEPVNQCIHSSSNPVWSGSPLLVFLDPN